MFCRKGKDSGWDCLRHEDGDVSFLDTYDEIELLDYDALLPLASGYVFFDEDKCEVDNSGRKKTLRCADG